MLVDVRQLLALEVAEELVQRDVWWIIHLWVEHRDVKYPSQETSEYCNNTNWIKDVKNESVSMLHAVQ